MSGFTESAFERKCAELNVSQQSIQGLSQWLIHHRKQSQSIVKVWYKEFLKAQDHRKLTFIYLANDVVQNSRRKDTELGKAFAPTLKKAIEHMAQIPGDKTKKSLLRILAIWKERGIYEAPLMEDFQKTYLKAWETQRREDEELELFSGITTPPVLAGAEGQTSSQSQESKEKKKSRREKEIQRKRKLSEGKKTVEEWETDGFVQLEVKLSPSPYTEPPTEEELFRLIKEMENMPSTDAVTRSHIASLSPSVSNPNGVEEFCVDSDASRSLEREIHAAYRILHDYDRKLDDEVLDRKKFSMKLQDFLHAQKDLLTQAEQRLEEHQTHQGVLVKKLEELKSHVLSMPDLTKLPSVTDGGLQPLPSAGDLFL